MATFTKGTAHLSRSSILEINSFESRDGVEIDDTLSVTIGEYSVDDDIVIRVKRNAKSSEKDEDAHNVWESVIDISKEQAICLAHFLLSLGK